MDYRFISARYNYEFTFSEGKLDHNMEYVKDHNLNSNDLYFTADDGEKSGNNYLIDHDWNTHTG